MLWGMKLRKQRIFHAVFDGGRSLELGVRKNQRTPSGEEVSRKEERSRGRWRERLEGKERGKGGTEKEGGGRSEEGIGNGAGGR